jgi:hypothetical protein
MLAKWRLMAALLANRIVAALVVAGSIAAFWYVAANKPGVSGWYPPCMFHMTTGLHCPGCGGTRAVHHALNGEVGTAFNQNALAVVVLPLVAVALLSVAAFALTGHWFGKVRVPPAIVWAVVGVLVLFAILRNLPGFEWLAPR